MRNTYTEGSGKCREIVKHDKNEKCTLQDLEYGEKTETMGNETKTMQDLIYGKKI